MYEKKTTLSRNSSMPLGIYVESIKNPPDTVPEETERGKKLEDFHAGIKETYRVKSAISAVMRPPTTMPARMINATIIHLTYFAKRT